MRKPWLSEGQGLLTGGLTVSAGRTYLGRSWRYKHNAQGVIMLVSGQM